MWNSALAKNRSMNDINFKVLLARLHRTHKMYCDTLREAEEEYKRRFGNYPSDVDDDYWIDSFCQSPIGATLENIEKHALIANSKD